MVKTILVVEDEAIVLLDIRFKLESLGHKVFVADNGKDAIEIEKNNHIDIVLMDINLKGDIDGIETSKIIYKNSKTPIIFSTANFDLLKNEDFEFEKSCIRKPFNVDELVESMNSLFSWDL